MNRLNKIAASLAAALVMASGANAREPGVLPPMAPGATMGVPIAAPLPQGLFFSSRSAYTNLEYHDGNGDKTGVDIVIPDTALVLSYTPGVELFGGQYRTSVALPLINVEVSGLASGSATGYGSLDLRPIDISWQTAPGIFVNAGVSFLAPGDWSASSATNVGQNFWSVAPSVGFSYLRDGWNASAHLIYTANTRNGANDYKSGDEVNLNLTAMKDIGNDLSVGPVAYWRKQVTADSNNGTAYGGITLEEAEAAGLGLSATKKIGNVYVNAMYSRDLEVVEAGGGERFWLNFSLPLGK